MVVRLSLKNLLRDTVLMLCGTVLGILLAQGFMASHIQEARMSHLAKREEATDTVLGLSSSQAITEQPVIINKEPQVPSKRPKSLAEELEVSPRKSLYIGVVTAKSLLSTRAVAINQTWGAKASKIEFFSSSDSQTANIGLPVVSLPDVDDTYPPQKKVYRMLKYMNDNYINDYNWFMRADDDVYVRTEHMMLFLSKLDPNQMLYVGQPGGGKPEDLERIKLKPHEHYCMGGPGVIYSRALLVRLAPHLEDCLKNEVVSWNEDLEVGRCISRRLGVQCTWNYEMSQLFMNDYSNGEIFKSPEVYNNKKLPNALTLHSFKDPAMMRRIHQYYIELAITNSLARTSDLKRDLDGVAKMTQRDRAFA